MTPGVPPVTPATPAPVAPVACPTCGQKTTPWWKDNENQKDIATILGVLGELLNAYSKSIPPGVSVGAGILLRAGLNFFGGAK